MLRLMVVDDEPIVRRGIRESIDWAAHGVSIVAEAGDGETATRLVAEAMPDVVIADVRMPLCNGLEFAGRIRRRFPSVKVVILSGYADFQYAQQALRLGAEDYLLKPVGAEELVRLVVRLRDEKEHYTSVAPVDRSEVEDRVRALLAGRLDEIGNAPATTWADRWRDMEQEDQMVLLAEVDHPPVETGGDVSRTDMAVRFSDAVVRLLFDEGMLAARLAEGRIVGLVSHRQDVESATSKLCAEIRRIARDLSIASLTIGLSTARHGLEGLRASSAEARLAVRSKAYLGLGRTIPFHDAVEIRSTPREYPMHLERRLTAALRAKQIDRLRSDIALAVGELRRERTPMEHVHQIALRLYFAGVRTLDEGGIATDTLYEGPDLPHLQIRECATFDEVSRWLTARYEQLDGLLASRTEAGPPHFVTRAIEYVEHNYDRSLTLREAAEAVYVTPNYLSHMFHEQTGRTFKEWLSRYRVDRARELLATTSLRTYEIAARVGYADYKYFSKTFKRLVGCSPGDYRNRAAAGHVGHG